MQVKIAELREALEILEIVVPRKSTVPIVTHVLIDGNRAIATDLEVSVSVRMSCTEGKCLLPGKSLLKSLAYVPGNLDATIEQTGKNVQLSWKGGTVTYTTDYTADYPDITDVTGVEGIISDGDSMIKTMHDILKYASDDNGRPVLCGVTVTFGDAMEVAAADGFRMGYQTLPLTHPANKRVTIPPNLVMVLSKIWRKITRPVVQTDSLIQNILAKHPITVTLSDERISITFDRVTIISNLIQGTAPNFAEYIQQTDPTSIMVMAEELARCLKQVEVIVGKKDDTPVRLEWHDNSLTVTVKKDDNCATAEMGIVSAVPSGRIAINYHYLSEYLKNRSGLITISTTSQSSPIVFKHGKRPLVIIMPVMLKKWETHSTPEPNPEPEPVEEEEIEEEVDTEAMEIAEETIE